MNIKCNKTIYQKSFKNKNINEKKIKSKIIEIIKVLVMNLNEDVIINLILK